MSSTQDSPNNRTLKARKAGAGAGANPPSITNPGHSGPTTFFLKSEKEVRGRRMSRNTGTVDEGEESKQKTPMGGSTVDESSSYGVESLEDAISASYTEGSLERTDSNATDENVVPTAAAESSDIVSSRKRKAGNPVHPRIAAAGQRIISSEHQHSSTYTSATGSPVSLRSSESPLRTHLRRGSATSSINLSQPLTPLKGSPSHAAGTPRSGSPKSFRLSDEEEVSVASDAGSQAVASSSGDDEHDGVEEGDDVPAAMPQLVMPSIAMPARRPFTERGRRIGRLRVMVAGPKGVGKTSLIQSLCRTCEDVVHIDPVSSGSTQRITEIGASTKPYPQWRSDVETSQRLRRASVSEGVLERNLTFVDMPGLDGELDGEGQGRGLREYLEGCMARMLDLRHMSDGEVLGMLGGEGGTQVDAIVFMLDPGSECGKRYCGLLQELAKLTTVVPVIGRSDTLSADDLQFLKEQVRQDLAPLALDAHPMRSSRSTNSPPHDPLEPLAVSSALADDSETMDASVLMSSTYLQPLLPSDLSLLASLLLEPDNIARLRHLSANKFLLWRHSHASTTDLPKQTLLTFQASAPSSLNASLHNNEEADPSKVLVPHASSSYFRSVSPSASDSSSAGGARFALENITEPFRQVRLARWAQDLRRSLDGERNRYKQMYANAPSEWASSAGEEEKGSDPDRALTTTASAGTSPEHARRQQHARAAKGRLGGSLGVIDPRDPLGLLAAGHVLRRQGWFALQIASGAGLVGAVVWWVARNWVEVQEWFGFGGGMQGQVPVSVVSISGPTGRGWMEDGREWLEEGMQGAREWEGWVRSLVAGVGK